VSATIKISQEAREILRHQKSIGATYTDVIINLVAIREEHLTCLENRRRHHLEGT
jgi:predicted CopG family antitoxin